MVAPLNAIVRLYLASRRYMETTGHVAPCAQGAGPMYACTCGYEDLFYLLMELRHEGSSGTDPRLPGED